MRIHPAIRLIGLSLLPLSLLAEGHDSAPSGRPEIGTIGLDLTASDPSVKPGDNFFRYANGHWIDTFQIPDDRSNYGVFTRLSDLSEKRVRGIIEDAAAMHAANGTPEQRIGDYYAAFLDEGTIEAAGLHPIQADLDRIAAANSPKDIASLFGLPGYMSTFGAGIGPDLKDPNRYSISIGQGGLGLPDRDYYSSDDPKLKEIRARYQAYVRQMLELGGVSGAADKSREVLDFETAVAKVSWSKEQQREIETQYNPRSKAELIAYATGFDWQAFLDSSEIGSRDHFVLNELSAIREIAAVIGSTPLDALKAYLTFHFLDSHAPLLPKRFDEAHFAFFGQTLQGQPKQRERWKRAVAAVDGAMGEQVGQVYVQKYFPPESKAKMEALVANLMKALSKRFDALEWMTPETKAKAQDKLAHFTTKIGYPDKWKDYSTLVVRRDDPVGNELRAELWEWHRELARIDEPVDRAEWGMTPQTINAYYNPQNNEVVFPAAILQPPFFDPNADPAVNYGGIGAVIGHEITHGFDDQGRKYAPDGSLHDWWTAEDAKAFTARAQRLVDEFSAFEPLPGLKIRGSMTLGENIADLGGLNIAHDAYRLSLGGNDAPVIEGLTGDQRFFLSFAQIWRAKVRDESLRQQVMSNPHSPAVYRVNGQVPNIDAWYSAFDVKPGDKMYVAPGDRVRIW